MLLKTDKDLLKNFLDTDPDCEQIGEGEYVADIYDTERPLTLNLLLTKDGFTVLAAAYLLYDEEQDGWYMGEQTEDQNQIEAVLAAALSHD